jgi:NAD+ kinase
MKIGIFGSSHHIDKFPLIRRLFDNLDTLGAEILIDKELGLILAEEFDFRPNASGFIEGEDFNIDIALSVGGDGTFLKTAARVNRRSIPILGINAGRLGFLADVGEEEIDACLEGLFRKDYRIEERTLVRLHTEERLFSGYNYALNEIAILKRDTSSMLSIHASIDDEFLATYMADGLIIATPTGSTAYALSVGGPVIVPQSASLIIAPIAPHSLNMRPLIVPDSSVISLVIESRTDTFLVSLDGRSEPFPAGALLTIAKADYKALVVKRNSHTFYNTLRKKLLWGADARSY